MQDDPSLVEAAVADLQAVVERDPACETFVQPLLFFKGFQVGAACVQGSSCLGMRSFNTLRANAAAIAGGVRCCMSTAVRSALRHSCGPSCNRASLTAVALAFPAGHPGVPSEPLDVAARAQGAGDSAAVAHVRGAGRCGRQLC